MRKEQKKKKWIDDWEIRKERIRKKIMSNIAKQDGRPKNNSRRKIKSVIQKAKE